MLFSPENIKPFFRYSSNHPGSDFYTQRGLNETIMGLADLRLAVWSARFVYTDGGRKRYRQSFVVPTYESTAASAVHVVHNIQHSEKSCTSLLMSISPSRAGVTEESPAAHVGEAWF